MKFYILSHDNINGFLSNFGENFSTGGAVVIHFSEFWGYTALGFLSMKFHKYLCAKYVSIEKK